MNFKEIFDELQEKFFRNFGKVLCQIWEKVWLDR